MTLSPLFGAVLRRTGRGLHYRNDQFLWKTEALYPEKLLISPGPCTPREAGVSCDMIRAFAERIPVFGARLGHQSIAESLGVMSCAQIGSCMVKPHLFFMMEVVSFRALNPFDATRYHSLIVKRETLPGSLRITAWTGVRLWGCNIPHYPCMGYNFIPNLS